MADCGAWRGRARARSETKYAAQPHAKAGRHPLACNAPGLQILGTPIPEREVYVATYDADGEPLDVQMFPQLEAR